MHNKCVLLNNILFHYTYIYYIIHDTYHDFHGALLQNALTHNHVNRLVFTTHLVSMVTNGLDSDLSYVIVPPCCHVGGDHVEHVWSIQF